MGRGRVTPIEMQERIRTTHAVAGTIAETARQLGLPESTVRKYVSPAERDEFAQIRGQKLAEELPKIVDEIAEAQRAIIKAMRDPAKIAQADMRDLATAFGILTDKHQLLTGQPTQRNHNLNEGKDPATILTPEEMEQAARIRERFAGAPR